MTVNRWRGIAGKISNKPCRPAGLSAEHHSITCSFDETDGPQISALASTVPGLDTTATSTRDSPTYPCTTGSTGIRWSADRKREYRHMSDQAFAPPSLLKDAFCCPHCGVYAHMTWLLIAGHKPDIKALILDANTLAQPYHLAVCSCCQKSSCWAANDQENPAASTYFMCHPATTRTVQPHPAMPSSVAQDYREAMTIAQQSPRAAAALLRLAIQKLCKELGESGNSINADIGALVRKGLPIEIQQALDVVRVVGNNAVHPGEISADDIEDITPTLFDLVNMIVEDRIARPRKLADMFKSLPSGAIAAITKRDGTPA